MGARIRKGKLSVIPALRYTGGDKTQDVDMHQGDDFVSSLRKSNLRHLTSLETGSNIGCIRLPSRSPPYPFL